MQGSAFQVLKTNNPLTQYVWNLISMSPLSFADFLQCWKPTELVELAAEKQIFRSGYDVSDLAAWICPFNQIQWTRHGPEIYLLCHSFCHITIRKWFYFANAGIAASIACDFLTDLGFFGLLIMQTNVTNQIIRARTYWTLNSRGLVNSMLYLKKNFEFDMKDQSRFRGIESCLY